MNATKIGFLGLFGQGNFGNDCSLEAVLYHARSLVPHAELMCSCTGPEEISARFSICTFPIRAEGGNVWAPQRNWVVRFLRRIFVRLPLELLHWFKAFQAMKGTEMLIAPGTGLLVDHTTGPFGFPYYVFKWAIIARLCHCRLLFVSVGAGPIYHPLSRWFIKRALSMADYRSYRDRFTKQYLDSIGFNTNSDPVYPDLAFSLPRAMMPECKEGDSHRLVVGVGVIDYSGQHNKHSIHQRGGRAAIYRNYLSTTATFVERLCNNKYSVRVLIGDVKYDSQVRQDLLAILQKRGLQPGNWKITSEPIISFDQLLHQIAATDIVVSPRFHNIILALMLNKPVISVSYNGKFESLMGNLHLTEYCQHIDTLDVAKVIEQLHKLETNAKIIKPYLRDKTEEFRRALDKQYAAVFKKL